MKNDEAIQRLMIEFGYPLRGAILVWDKLENISSTLTPDFTLWWEQGKLPDIEINGYKFDQLIAEHRMNPIAAFLTLDWLIREPQAAQESLKKGHDQIIRSNK